MSRPRVEIAPKSRSPSIGSSTSRSRSRGSVQNQASSMDHLQGKGDHQRYNSKTHWGPITFTQSKEEGDIYRLGRGEGDGGLIYERGRHPVVSRDDRDMAHPSHSSRERAAVMLDEFEKHTGSPPRRCDRCQARGAHALGELERREIVPRGAEEYWHDNSRERLEKDGRSWIPNPDAGIRPEGPVDAKCESPVSRPQPRRVDISKHEDLPGDER